MSKLLISKNGRMSKGLLFCGVVFVLSAIALIISGEGRKHGYRNSEMEDLIMNGLPFLVLFGGLMVLMAAFSTAKTCISVYNDRIEGVGVGKFGIGAHSFCFTKDLQYTVQRNNATLKVNCGGESYNITLSAADAEEVYRCVNSGAGFSTFHQTATNAAPAATKNPYKSTSSGTNANSKPQPTAAKSVIKTCPNCNAKLRLPTGKGIIRITCPKCKNAFQSES